ncbi:hypothetical protein [Listeria sp. ILCC797]|uniref:hypothetical protein n=1 Tax=Listeria sp. ILCC797 TaxID=1918333 RepID=UPI000B58A818|nr:hypothetical protein [Listeria sp. ILCC797]
MKKVFTLIIVGLIVISFPTFSASAQKNIAITSFNMYNKMSGWDKYTIKRIQRGSIINYHGAGKISFGGKVGYNPYPAGLTAPVSSNGWYAAVVKRTHITPGTTMRVEIYRNEIVRVKPSVGANVLGQYRIRCAVANYNGKWKWDFWVKPSDIIRVDGWAYNSIAQYTTL